MTGFSLEPDMALDPSVYGPVFRVENAFSDQELNNLTAYIHRLENQCTKNYTQTEPVTRSVEVYSDYGFTTGLASYLLHNYKGIELTMWDMMAENTTKWKWLDPEPNREPLVAHETLRQSTPGKIYKTHQDLPSKKMTCLIYLQPKYSGNGTIFNGRDQNKNTEYKWEYNTGYIFKPNTFSWHSYKNNQTKNRYVYMINLYVDPENKKPGVRRQFITDMPGVSLAQNPIDKIIPI